ncbi:MAG TPA: type II toxin-antitoxin system VapB family antitoxin [Thermoanaerobaculia bacterium]|nr:type II toxin-antitoxin system VapB family antitoxin [Thermoanaerobaculia bacterium]
MKRTNVILDEELLESARRALGEKTYSGAITRALEKVVKQEKFWEAYREFEKLAHSDEGFFDPEYLKEKTAKSLTASKQRVSAHDVRMARDKKRSGSR